MAADSPEKERIRTTVERPMSGVTSQSPPDDCIEVIEESIADLENASTFIQDAEWDEALERLEAALAELVALRDAILSAQHTKR